MDGGIRQEAAADEIEITSKTKTHRSKKKTRNKLRPFLKKSEARLADLTEWTAKSMGWTTKSMEWTRNRSILAMARPIWGDSGDGEDRQGRNFDVLVGARTVGVEIWPGGVEI